MKSLLNVMAKKKRLLGIPMSEMKIKKIVVHFSVMKRAYSEQSIFRYVADRSDHMIADLDLVRESWRGC